VGVEPTRPFEHSLLRTACLPFHHSGGRETIASGPPAAWAPSARDNRRPVEAAARQQLISELCAFEGRGPGTDAERRAANHLAERLESGGRRAEIEPTHVHPNYALVHALHLALAVAGSLVAVAVPAAGLAIVLLAAASLYWDLHARFYLLRRLFFRRASQNVLARGRLPDAQTRIILCAHYDAARTGAVFSDASVRRAARLRARLPFSPAPYPILFTAMVLLIGVIGARMAGVEGEWLGVLQIVPTVVLLAGLLPLIDIALSPVIPGANGNASGVATALSACEELDAAPPANLDLWLLLSGGGASTHEGMRAFLRAHADELAATRTFFLEIDSVGSGELRYLTSERALISIPMDQRLIELAAAVSEVVETGAEPLRHGLATEALPIALAGHPVIALTTRPRGALAPANHRQPEDKPTAIEEAALDRAQRFAVALVGALDRETERRLSTG
jgi:Peptidase family M28